MKNAEKTTSKHNEIVPVVNVFKLLPQVVVVIVAEITTSDEELLLVTKMIEAEEVAKKIKKIQEDEEVQGGGRATMVRGNTMGVRPPPPTQADWSQAKIANPCTKQPGNGS